MKEKPIDMRKPQVYTVGTGFKYSSRKDKCIMHETQNDTVFMVVYECGSSLIHEYMSESDFRNLENKEKDGSVRIMDDEYHIHNR